MWRHSDFASIASLGGIPLKAFGDKLAELASPSPLGYGEGPMSAQVRVKEQDSCSNSTRLQLKLERY
jgi:hypothetical protein